MNDSDALPAGEPPATPTEMVLGKFIEAVLEKLQRGEAVVVETLLHDRPDLVERGRQLVQGLASFRQTAPAPGPAPATDERPPLPETLTGPLRAEAVLPDPFPGEFRIRRLLGEGAFGKVWLADDVRLGRPVALKTLRFPSGSADGAVTLAALQKEANFLASIRHPNVVQVYAWRQAGDDHYLVMEYVHGGSLADLVKKEGPLPWQRAARYVADVAEGLLAVHAGGIVHRDIKAANTLWDSDHDEAKLTDFGVSGRLAEARTVAGTPLYMAPEAFRGRATAASDVYSLAATLFHLVTGQVPFPGPSWDELIRQAEQGLPEADPRWMGIPEALERVIRDGLAADAGTRPSLQRFVDMLRGALNQVLADELATPAGGTATGPDQAPVDLRLIVSRETGPGVWCPAATTHPQTGPLRRDLKRVPRQPEQVRLRTGDQVRVEVTANRGGFVTVFNVGPTGNLNLLYPDEPTRAGAPPDIRAGQPLHVLDVELEPPTGRERLFAVWSRGPLPLRVDEMKSLAEAGGGTGSRPYQASRDMKRVKEAVQGLRMEERAVAVLEMDHHGD